MRATNESPGMITLLSIRSLPSSSPRPAGSRRVRTTVVDAPGPRFVRRTSSSVGVPDGIRSGAIVTSIIGLAVRAGCRSACDAGAGTPGSARPSGWPGRRRDRTRRRQSASCPDGTGACRSGGTPHRAGSAGLQGHGTPRTPTSCRPPALIRPTAGCRLAFQGEIRHIVQVPPCLLHALEHAVVGEGAADLDPHVRAPCLGPDVARVPLLAGQDEVPVDRVHALVVATGDVPVPLHDVGPSAAARRVVQHALDVVAGPGERVGQGDDRPVVRDYPVLAGGGIALAVSSSTIGIDPDRLVADAGQAQAEVRLDPCLDTDGVGDVTVLAQRVVRPYPVRPREGSVQGRLEVSGQVVVCFDLVLELDQHRQAALLALLVTERQMLPLQRPDLLAGFRHAPDGYPDHLVVVPFDIPPGDRAVDPEDVDRVEAARIVAVPPDLGPLDVDSASMPVGGG